MTIRCKWEKQFFTLSFFVWKKKLKGRNPPSEYITSTERGVDVSKNRDGGRITKIENFFICNLIPAVASPTTLYIYIEKNIKNRRLHSVCVQKTKKRKNVKHTILFVSQFSVYIPLLHNVSSWTRRPLNCKIVCQMFLSSFFFFSNKLICNLILF